MLRFRTCDCVMVFESINLPEISVIETIKDS